MKNSILLGLLLFVPVAFLSANSQVIIHGTVTDSNGAPVVNHAVHASAMWQGAVSSFTSYTDTAGFYQDTLFFSNTNPGFGEVWITNCNGDTLSQYAQWGSAHTIQVNFNYCQNIGGPSCEAHFIAQAGTAPLTYNFYNQSKGDSIWYTWSFGDGTGSSAPHPQHTYNSPGAYEVCLEIWDSTGCHDIMCDSILVSNNCHASFTYHVDGDTAYFNDASLGQQLSYVWVFGDGDSAFTANPMHIYDTTGTYQVCLYIQGQGGCTDHYCLSVQVPGNTKNCDAAFSFQVNDSLVSFYNNSTGTNLSYLWNFGDGHTSTQQNPTHVYLTPGTYSVCLVVYTQQVGGCTDSFCTSVTISNTLNCDANFTYQANGNTVQFKNQSLGSYNIISWSFGDGTGSSAFDPTHTYASTGHYVVCLTVEDSNTSCIDTYCDTVVVNNSGQNKFTIAGQIFAGNTIAMHAFAILYQDSAGVLIAIDTQQVDSTYYMFTHVDSGTYYVVGWLDSTSPYYNQYMPTYFDTAIYWQNAVPINVGPSYYHGHIHLHAQLPQNGNGFVQGNLTIGSGKTWGAGDPIANASVYLRNDNDVPIRYDQTNSSGVFSFKNVEQGYYTLYVEMVNFNCQPFAITLNNDGDTIGNINFQASENQVITGIQPFTGQPLENVEIAPNPFDEVLRLNLGNEINGEITVVLLNIDGRVIWQQKMESQKYLEISTEQLPAGMYFINIRDEQNRRMIQKAVKMN